ncbi:MAG: tetratricopeptide repeat protein [Sphingobacteriales bacterium]|nr:tetratricopeptide repeat protein [Sphingobacteriales bacterium]
MKICKLIFFSTLLITAFISQAQNLFDEEHSRQYAEFLFSAGKYEEARQEYKRLLLLDDLNTDVRLREVQCLRYSGQLREALKRMEDYRKKGGIISYSIEIEYVKLLLLNRESTTFRKVYLPQSILNDSDKVVFILIDYLLNKDFKKTDEFRASENFSNPAYKRLTEINSELQSIRMKNPLVGGLLSTAIPGLGKIYSGFWQDGLISLLYTGMSAFQAYRSFKKDGIRSIFGWYSAMMTAAFYSGNIYGSVKAVSKYNQLKTELFNREIEEILFNYY